MKEEAPVIEYRWAIIFQEGRRTEFLEVKDVMDCIKAPGDFGWVEGKSDPSLTVTVDFEHLFKSREEAIAAWREYQTAIIEKARREIAYLNLISDAA